jgi:hypothetical protein
MRRPRWIGAAPQDLGESGRDAATPSIPGPSRQENPDLAAECRRLGWTIEPISGRTLRLRSPGNSVVLADRCAPQVEAIARVRHVAEFERRAGARL